MLFLKQFSLDAYRTVPFAIAGLITTAESLGVAVRPPTVLIGVHWGERQPTQLDV
jgi:hypothetical protein